MDLATARGMDRSLPLYPMTLLMGLCWGACDCTPNTLEPSMNTVDPSTHEPYQPKMPKATGNPMSAEENVPEPPDDNDDAKPGLGTP